MQAPGDVQRVGFYCGVCDTRLVARVTDVGRKGEVSRLWCSHRGAAPPKSRPKKVPKAMHGQQYGVWGVDDAPHSAELAAKQPKFFPVFCRVCDTLMQARTEQVGKKLICPDCGAKTVVEAPPPPKPKKSALVPDGQEYQLDPTDIPPTPPVPQFMPAEAVPQASKSEEIRAERRHRPRPPRVPTIQGVVPMLVRSPLLGWWLWLTVVAVSEVLLLSVVMSEAADVFGMLFQLACYAMAFALGGLGLSAASALWLRLLTESSEGNDRLHHPPGVNFLEWFGDMLYLITSGLLALAPWWLLCRVFENEMPVEVQGLVQAAGWLFTFPLLLLSCLENGSPLELVSPKVFGSVSKLPGRWLLLLVQSVVIVASCVATAVGLFVVDPRLALLAAPLWVAASLVYFRILGRFAWWLAESLATMEKE